MAKLAMYGITAAAAIGPIAGGTAVTLADPTDVPRPEKQNTAARDGRAVRTPLAAIDTSTSAKFTPIEPCRIANTVTTGATIGANKTRAFKVVGNLGGQGGSGAGCGVPSSATALTVGIVTEHATGNGTLRIAPYGTAPTYALMAFTKATTSGQPVIPLGTGSYGFNVTAAYRATDVVITATGYYVKPMFALVSGNGALMQNSRVVGSVNHVADTGVYYVYFDRAVSHCAYSATTYLYGYVANAEEGGVTGVYIHIVDSATKEDADVPFYVAVTC